MPSFLQNLRMAGLFGNQRNPFLPIQREQVQGIENPPPPLPPPLAGNLATIAQQFWKKPGQEPNVVFGQNINPYQQAQLEQKEADRQSREKIASGREETARAGQEISQQRANVYAFKASAEGQDAKFIINKVTGAMQAINPRDAKVIKDFGQMQIGQEDLINLNQEKALERIGAGGEEARSTEGLRARNREELERLRAAERERLKGIPSADTENQKKIKLYQRAQEAYNTHPEWRSSIKLGTGNSFQIVADPSKGFGWTGGEEKSKKIFDDIQKFMQGSDEVTEPPKKNNTPQVKKSDSLGIRK